MPKLIGIDESDSRIDVPVVNVPQASPPQGTPQASTPDQQVDVPQALRDSLAAPSGEFNGAIAPNPIQNNPLDFTLPDAPPDPFAGAEDAVKQDLADTAEAGKYVQAPDQLQPLSYGLSQSDQQLQHWIEDQRNATYNWQPQELPAVQGKAPQELDPSVAGGFKPTSQDKPWWGDFEPTGEFNPFKGNFGDFGKGLLPGVFSALNTAQAVTQGIGSDVARLAAGVVGGLEKVGVKPDVGDAFRNVWNLSRLITRDPYAVGKAAFDGAVNSVRIATKLPDFVKGFQDNYSRLSPVATGQKPLTNLPANNGLQRLRNQSYFVSGITGRNLSGTDEKTDDNKRFNPLGQRQGKDEKQAPTAISNVGARLSAEAASVTSFVSGQGFLTGQQKESVYRDVRTSQIGGFVRGLAIDVISGEALESLTSAVVKKGINSFVRRVGKPLEATTAAVEAVEVIAKKPIVIGAKPSNGYIAPQHLKPHVSLTKKLPGTPERLMLPPTSSNPERTFVVKPGTEFRSAPDGSLTKPSNVGVFKEGQLLPLPGQPTRLANGIPFKENRQFTLPGSKKQFALPESKGRPQTVAEPAQTALGGTPERAALPPTSSQPDRVFVVKPSGVFEVNPGGDAKQVSYVGIFKNGDLQPLPGEATKLVQGQPFKENTLKALEGNNPLALPEQAGNPKRMFVNEPQTPFKDTRNTAEVPLVDGLVGETTTDAARKNAVDLGDAKSRSVGQVADVPTRDIETVIPQAIPDEPFKGVRAGDELVAEAPTNVATKNVKQFRNEVPVAEAQVFDPERYKDEWSVFVTPEAVDAVAFNVIPQQFLAGRIARREVGGFAPKGLLDQSIEVPVKEVRTLERQVPGTPINVQTIDVAARDITEKRLTSEAPQRVLAEYQEAAPGLFLKPSQTPLETPVGRSTPYQDGTPSEALVTPHREVLEELAGAIKAEVFSPQLSLGDLAELVTKQQPGMTYNPAMVKRGQRKLDSMVSLAQKVTLPDGTPIIAAGTNGINTWAKFYNRIDFATGALDKEQKDAFKRIFAREGVPLPSEIPDTFAVQIRAAKVDAPELVSVVSQPYVPPVVTSYKVDPASLKDTGKKGWAKEQLDRLEKTSEPDNLIEPDLTRDKTALSMYQKDLPNTLVTKSREGVKLTNERLVTENEIAHIAEQSVAAKKELATISRQVDDHLTALDKVPDAAPRTLLTDPNADSLEELFMKADRIGNKYQTPEEIAAFNKAEAEANAQLGDAIDQAFPDTTPTEADFRGLKPTQQQAVKVEKTAEQLAQERAAIPTRAVPGAESATQKKTRELQAKMAAYKASKEAEKKPKALTNQQQQAAVKPIVEQQKLHNAQSDITAPKMSTPAERAAKTAYNKKAFDKQGSQRTAMLAKREALGFGAVPEYNNATGWSGLSRKERYDAATNEMKQLGIKPDMFKLDDAGVIADEVNNLARLDRFEGTIEETFTAYLNTAVQNVKNNSEHATVLASAHQGEGVGLAISRVDTYYDEVHQIPSVTGEETMVRMERPSVEMYHGNRVDNIEYKTVDPVLSEPRGDLGVGIYVSKNVDEATSNAMAEVKRNTPPVSERVYGAANVSTIQIKPGANLVEATSNLTPEMQDIFIVQAERLLSSSPDGDLAVASYVKALEKKPHTVAQAYALIEDKLLKASKKMYGTATLDEGDVLKWQRAVAVELRVSGIDGVSHKTGVAIYNPDVISLKKVTTIGDTLDTLEIAVHRFNADSLAVERHPDSAYLKASLAETKVRVLGELQDKAEALVKQTNEMMDTQVARLVDIDKTLKGLAQRENIDRGHILKRSEETAYDGFKKELNTVNDTPCL